MENEGMEDPSKQFDEAQAVEGMLSAVERVVLFMLGLFWASLNNIRRRRIA
ncbi:hypothetical protein GM415_03095 [Pseudodesulfovibrio cashew]|uniref:Uncharacterized protein n=1 Tax=Pseudodesulfovibrio cashew TaxID=2678688 RepID=A0A6I6JDB6_9BACT|nr:hypothetical protein [Pseudodesulfovibrio cashew]QGY39149.1 hypothetical protein GM415_03095 [Pseudodesulfovibrio cashew]